MLKMKKEKSLVLILKDSVEENICYRLKIKS